MHRSVLVADQPTCHPRCASVSRMCPRLLGFRPSAVSQGPWTGFARRPMGVELKALLVLGPGARLSRGGRRVDAVPLGDGKQQALARGLLQVV